MLELAPILVASTDAEQLQQMRYLTSFFGGLAGGLIVGLLWIALRIDR